MAKAAFFNHLRPRHQRQTRRSLQSATISKPGTFPSTAQQSPKSDAADDLQESGLTWGLTRKGGRIGQPRQDRGTTQSIEHVSQHWKHLTKRVTSDHHAQEQETASLQGFSPSSDKTFSSVGAQASKGHSLRIWRYDSLHTLDRSVRKQPGLPGQQPASSEELTRKLTFRPIEPEARQAFKDYHAMDSVRRKENSQDLRRKADSVPSSRFSVSGRSESAGSRSSQRLDTRHTATERLQLESKDSEGRGTPKSAISEQNLWKNKKLGDASGRRLSKFELDESTEDAEPQHRRRSTGAHREAMRSYSRRQSRYHQDEEDDDVDISRIERKRQRKLERLAQKQANPPIAIILPEFISVANLASALRVRIEDFVQRLATLGFQDVDYDFVLDGETAGLVATEFNFEPTVTRASLTEDLVALPPPTDETFVSPRPPVITIMGHVDHGKTTLLDWLRKSSVAASEHGGITQHIGAFTVKMPAGATITFLDTPGHAAFLNMRQRGANVTDIVILVVAADDSVKPQTIEAISHAQAAKVPVIVAINKIDKPDADPERVKLDLSRHGINIEDFGGDTQVVCVSGKTGIGMSELEDAAMTLADVLDLRAQTTGPVEGWILEAATKKAGRMATLLVRRGTITPGTILVAGTTWARVKVLRDEAGNVLDAAKPGMPVEIDGWRELPAAGDEALQAADEQLARRVVADRVERLEKESLSKDVAAVNEARRIEQTRKEIEAKAKAERKRKEETAGELALQEEDPQSNKEAESKTRGISFILRADVSGSVEAVKAAILALGNNEVRASILRTAAGAVSESDVDHAAAAQGHIINFSQPIDPNISRMAEACGVKIIDGTVIYRLVDTVKKELEALLPDLRITRVVGEAEVAQIFDIGIGGRKKMRIAGCKIRNGVIAKSAKVRVLRDRQTVFDGKSCHVIMHTQVADGWQSRISLVAQEREEGCLRSEEGWRMWIGI